MQGLGLLTKEVNVILWTDDYYLLIGTPLFNWYQYL